MHVLVRQLRSSDARKMQRAINIHFHMSACKGARAVFATHEAIPVLKKIVRSPASLGRPLRDKALVTLAALTLFNVLPFTKLASGTKMSKLDILSNRGTQEEVQEPILISFRY